MYKSHPLFSSTLSLEILAYYDDVEVCNPLGSRAEKHKLGKSYVKIHVHVHVYDYFNTAALFYYTLGNIPPKYRSTIRCIQLFAVVKSHVLQQYGADAILETFMDGIRSLEEVKYTCCIYIYACIIESVDSICRDGTNTPISLNKSTCNGSELPNADVLCLFRQTACSSIHYNTLKVRKIHSYSDSRKIVNTPIVHLCRIQFKRPTAKLVLVITVILSRESFILERT